VVQVSEFVEHVEHQGADGIAGKEASLGVDDRVSGVRLVDAPALELRLTESRGGKRAGGEFN
jgi:hypothetical protein